MSSHFSPDVYISLTTIPTRLDRIVKERLLDLCQQDYTGIKKIFITIPLNNMRGQKAIKNLPTWFEDEPFKSKIAVLRPTVDHGPIMKWIGAVNVIPRNSWVFVCDDDVRYRHDYIRQCVDIASKCTHKNQTIFNADLNTEAIAIYKMRLILGVEGVFVHSNFINLVDHNFDRSLPKCCLRIDDDVVSIIARDNGYTKKQIPPGINLIQAIKDSAMQADSLSGSYNRTKDRHKCHAIINPDYADGLLDYVTGFSISTIVLFIIVIVLVVLLYRHRRRCLSSK